MNKEWKEKWIDALRSGKYKQGQFLLRNMNKYCCLGVLCDIHPDVKFTGNRAKHSKDLFYTDGGLSSTFREKMELTLDECRELVRMNDRKGNSFMEIADFIEENL